MSAPVVHVRFKWKVACPMTKQQLVKILVCVEIVLVIAMLWVIFK